MCLYSEMGRNPKFRPNKKNGFNPPKCTDERIRHIPFKCGHCHECRKQKQREWRVRLSEEIRTSFAYFITLTFDDNSINELVKKTGYDYETQKNNIATQAIRYFLERVRKDTGKSLRHWFITELGEDNGRLHLHGFVFGQKGAELVRKHWKYGFIFIGGYVNEKTINYCTKYCTKVNPKYPEYTQIILCSKGIGKGYIQREKYGWQKKNYKKITVPTYTFRNGSISAMPKYYKDRIFTDEERETMWINNLIRGKTWIGGEKVDADDFDTINNLTKYYRRVGVNIWFDNPKEWDEQKTLRRYERQRKAVAKMRHANTT